jgi:hypothetical protein
MVEYAAIDAKTLRTILDGVVTDALAYSQSTDQASIDVHHSPQPWWRYNSEHHELRSACAVWLKVADAVRHMH